MKKPMFPVCILCACLGTASMLSAQSAEISFDDMTNPEAVTATGASTTIDAPTQAPIQVVGEEGSEALVSLSFDETAIVDVVKAFREATGANIISGTDSNLLNTVSVTLDKVPWRKGLASILDIYGFALTERDPGSAIYIVEARRETVPIIKKTFVLNHAKVDEVADMFNKTMGEKFAVPFKDSNVLVLTGTEKQLNESETVIKAVDKPIPQVYIEARFVRLNASASKQLGIKWTTLAEGFTVSSKDVAGVWTRSHEVGVGGTTWKEVTGGTQENPTTSYVAVPAGFTDAHTRNLTGTLGLSDFALTMQAIEQMEGTTIFSNPKIIVANERKAIVDMTTKYPCVDVTSSRDGQSGSLDITAKLATIPGQTGPNQKEEWVGEAFFSYGIHLTVTPRVSPNGLITVDVVPSISKQVGTYSVGSGSSGSTDSVYSQYPIIKMQRLTTRFSMKDGTTAVIGGLSDSTEENVDSGIPLLRDIPWAGPRFFGWKSRVQQQEEVVVFVTVGVVNPEEINQDVGMPKNAIFSKKVSSGEVKEPGDRENGLLPSIDTLKKD